MVQITHSQFEDKLSEKNVAEESIFIINPEDRNKCYHVTSDYFNQGKTPLVNWVEFYLIDVNGNREHLKSGEEICIQTLRGDEEIWEITPNIFLIVDYGKVDYFIVFEGAYADSRNFLYQSFVMQQMIHRRICQIQAIQNKKPEDIAVLKSEMIPITSINGHKNDIFESGFVYADGDESMHISSVFSMSYNEKQWKEYMEKRKKDDEEERKERRRVLEEEQKTKELELLKLLKAKYPDEA